MTVTTATPLRELALAAPNAIPLLMRFGLMPGYGQTTVGEALAAHNIDTTLFLSVVHAFFGTSDSASRLGQEKTSPDRRQTVRFLEATDRYHAMQLKNIGRHLGPLMSMSAGGKTSLSALSEFFGKTMSEFETRFRVDRERLFPAILAGVSGGETGEKEGVSSIVGEVSEHDRVLEEQVADLLSFFVVHLEPGADPNLLTAVITAISLLHSDLTQTNRVRQRLLVPSEEDDATQEESARSPLTTREKEVLSLLASGLSNKEVADRLCISLHTAITHRRNLTAKLGIRSLAGLSLYALMNGLISSK